MRLRLLISLSLCLCSWPQARAQLAPADDFFHGGAQLYLTNNIPQAKEVVAQGRQLYPDDEKLKKLEELLNQQQQSQSQSSQQQPQSPPQKPDDQKKSGDQKQPQNSQPPPKPDEQKKDEPKKPAPGEKKDDPKKPEQGQPMTPGKMTPEEAKRLLDSEKNGEQLLQLKPPGKPENSARKVKDW